MGSLFEELEAREAAARVQVEELEAELAEVSARLSAACAGLDRLRIARETVAEVLAEMTSPVPAVAVEVRQSPVAERVVSAYAGVERQVVGVLAVPNWQPGMGMDVLPSDYRDIVEVVSDAPGAVRAKQIAPRIGLPVSAAKIEGTRSKLKRLVERGWLDEDTPGLFTTARRRTGSSPNSLQR
ncbi:hypothetical protein OG500_19210 [Kitasatospora sp. NBC_01250]|uniref:hypothetical protein n=1 Tax=Kitasatospora sp. NBC_01250 TaxID=2903571 RepID=UPI002E2F7E3E|nr:hypothetical protein [Kitasatospora sp. NBC_01250]